MRSTHARFRGTAAFRCAFLAIALILAAGLVGCAQSVSVSLPYELPPDVPAPADPALLSVGTFQADGESAWAGDFLANELQKRIDVRRQKATTRPSSPTILSVGAQPPQPSTCAALWPATCQAATQPNVVPSPQELTCPAVLSGTIRVRVQDLRSNRVIRQTDRYHDIASQPAPMLVRKIDAVVEFTVQPQGQKAFSVETRHSYDSRNDYRSFGPLGLQRPDEPRNVPDADEALRQTLLICLDTFTDMIQPQLGQDRVELLGLKYAGAPKVMKLAQAAQHAQAADALRRIKPAPDDMAYVFDLAVLQEAAGQRSAALENYRKLAAFRTAMAAQARRGIARITRSGLMRAEVIGD